MHRRCGTSKVVDLVALNFERIGHIVAHHFKIWIFKQSLEIKLIPSKKVIHTDDFVAFFDKTL